MHLFAWQISDMVIQNKQGPLWSATAQSPEAKGDLKILIPNSRSQTIKEEWKI